MKWDVTGAMELSGMESGTSGQARVLGGGVRQQGRNDGQVVHNSTKYLLGAVTGRGQKFNGKEWSRERGSIHGTQVSRKEGSKFSTCLKYFKFKS